MLKSLIIPIKISWSSLIHQIFFFLSLIHPKKSYLSLFNWVGLPKCMKSTRVYVTVRKSITSLCIGSYYTLFNVSIIFRVYFYGEKKRRTFCKRIKVSRGPKSRVSLRVVFIKSYGKSNKGIWQVKIFRVSLV